MQINTRETEYELSWKPQREKFSFLFSFSQESQDKKRKENEGRKIYLCAEVLIQQRLMEEEEES